MIIKLTCIYFIKYKNTILSMNINEISHNSKDITESIS